MKTGLRPHRLAALASSRRLRLFGGLRDSIRTKSKEK
jgi:hypothetical protein